MIFLPIGQTDLSQALPNIPGAIFQFSEAPEPQKTPRRGRRAVPIAFVLVISIGARVLSARTRKRLAAAR